jgi:predicted amidophosphoribosyltransferase
MSNQPSPAGFPGCHRCAYFGSGAARACLACARRTVEPPAGDACLVCSQRVPAGAGCPNELCRSRSRSIGRIHAIGYHSGPLRQAINDYKYRGVRSWSAMFGRLLLAWLDEHMTADPPDLIVVNPGFAGASRQSFAHTEAVLAEAARQDQAGRWPFDTAVPAAITKTRPTLQSADAMAWSKRVSAEDLRSALAVPEPARTADRYVLVYDDICTTGTQLDVVAGCLLDRGKAARVDGIVLARALWRQRLSAG